jgi:general secretion pathway protein A
MYENYYNLNAMPFQITTDPKFLWLGEKHSEALATLKYGILENKGFLLLTGDVGTGKTALINRLVRMIDVAAIVAKVPDPGLSSLEFFNFLAIEFKMNKKFESKGEFLIHLKNFLLKAYDSHKKVLLIIDESQRLNHDLLEQIRLLSNIELQDRKLINIFFVGQTEFNEMLMEERNRAVRQRITVSYHIDPLTESEARLYIKHRLKVAGATRDIFGRDAVREIYNYSGGYPRLINIICDHALLTGYSYNLKSIDKKVIKECEKELYIPEEIGVNDGIDEANNFPIPNPPPATAPAKPVITRKAGIVAAIVMLLVFGVYFFFESKISDSPRWSMDDIAPQDYQGPAPEELKAREDTKVKVDEEKSVAPANTTPIEEEPTDIQKEK